MLLRKLNDNGIKAFEQYLSDLVVDPAKLPPLDLLTNPATSEHLDQMVEIDKKELPSRMEAGKYFWTLFAEYPIIERDPGVWSWLALFYFDQVCPVGKDGKRKIRESARYVASRHAWRYYRHLLAGPYMVFKAYRETPELAVIILYGSLSTITDYTEQLASRQEIVQNKAAIGAATFLYFDAESGKPKRGAAPTDRKPGTLRRFTDLINQLDPTFDLYSMKPSQLISKLPFEFEPFRAVT
jgi:hypothetical protein